MTTVQPDLFGDYDREAAEREEAEQRARTWREPATCPSCGTTEPTGYLLRNNHGYDPGELRISGYPQRQHPIYGPRCTAQDLVTNHITYYARRDDPDNLAHAAARGRELGLDVDAIITAAQEDTP